MAEHLSNTFKVHVQDIIIYLPFFFVILLDANKYYEEVFFCIPLQCFQHLGFHSWKSKQLWAIIKVINIHCFLDCTWLEKR